MHDPESDRSMLKKVAIGLAVAAVTLGLLARTVGYTVRVIGEICPVC